MLGLDQTKVGSPWQRAGSGELQPGDVLHSIDGIRVFRKTTDQVRELVTGGASALNT